MTNQSELTHSRFDFSYEKALSLAQHKVKEALSKEGKVYVDRSYVSTLAYNYIQYKSKGSDKYIHSLAWYMEGITDGKLVTPDAYIYIDIGAKESLSRAKKLGKFDKSIAWYEDPVTAKKFYEAFFNFSFPIIFNL